MLNRAGIRAALFDYKTARTQHEMILQDDEIQNLFAAENYEGANFLIMRRYPFGKWETVAERGIELIEVMTKGIPDFKGFEAVDIWRIQKYLKSFSNLQNGFRQRSSLLFTADGP
ncbi:hypothetical protein SD70_02680 [Gordoniibacillus kamchatkensis]|uniref:Uncharacterized protein n=1 Tax=Gordoniibacillus kamchatkensis TaxID=1590651 RepID=A0ABR5AM53_9BACL|nr:hypothetical protein [Paenibacillus sp. VKM B-2647]KIL42105.1 hypothetical protein SD70_02680 [Paenibacillus sp. VKM B-2647]